MKFEWNREDRYLSNDGKGPLMARILCATDTTVTMERWVQGGTKKTRFELPLKTFLSPTCGWKLEEREP